MKKLLTGDTILSIIENDVKEARFKSISQPKNIIVYLNPLTLREIYESKFKTKTSNYAMEYTIGETGDYCTLTFIENICIKPTEYDYSHFN